MKKNSLLLFILIGLIFILSLGVFAINDQGRPDQYGGHYSYNDKGKIEGYVYVEGVNDGWAVKCSNGYTDFTANQLKNYKPFKIKTELKVNNKLVWSKYDWYKYTHTPTSTPTAEPTNTPTAEPTNTPTTEPTNTPTTEPTNTPTETLITTDTPTTSLPEVTTSTPIETNTPIVNNSKNNVSDGLPQTGEGNIWPIIIVGITIILSGIMLFLIFVKKKIM